MGKDIIAKNAPELADFDRYAEKVLKDHKFPGMAVAIIRGDQVIHSKGYGFSDLEKKLPVDSETVFAIGSASKAFTAMAVGLLVEQGKLDWDQPLRTYLPTFKLYDPFASERMTPRDLLCHRSGLPRHDLMWYSSPHNRKEIFEHLSHLEPNRDFRTYFQYQNLMFMVAGYLVEVVSGLTWEDFVRREILKRLGMTRSNLSVEDSKQMDNVALPYREEKHKLIEIPFRNIDAVAPAGSINSCVADMARWVTLQMNGGQYRGKQIIGKANLEQMHTPTMPYPASFFQGFDQFEELGEGTYGLGWFMQTYRGHKLIHHGGHIDGFSAMVSFMPREKLGVIVLTNLNNINSHFAPLLHAYDCLLGLEPLLWNERFIELEKKTKQAAKAGEKKSAAQKVRGTRPSHPLDAYVGDYSHPGYGVIRVKLNQPPEKKLKAMYSGLKFSLAHYHYDIFEGTDEEESENKMKLSFFTDVQGNIASLSAPFEPMVKDIVFTRIASEEMRSKTFLQQFVGRYQLDKQVVEVRLIGTPRMYLSGEGEGTLAAAMPGMPEMELEPYQGTQFKVKGLPASLEFHLEGGKVTAVDISQMGAVFTALKIAEG